MSVKSIGGNVVFATAAFDSAKNGTRDLIAAPGAGKSIWVYGVFGRCSANAGTVKFIDSGPNDLSGTMPVVATDIDIEFPISPIVDAPWFKCAANKKLQVVLSADVDFDGVIVYAIRTN